MDLNYYQLLGVAEDATPEAIKTAYRKIIARYHPDLVGESGVEATKMFNEIYEILSDPSKREDYDYGLRHGHTSKTEPQTESKPTPEYTNPDEDSRYDPHFRPREWEAAKPEPPTVEKTSLTVFNHFSKRILIELGSLLATNILLAILFLKLDGAANAAGWAKIPVVGAFAPAILPAVVILSMVAVTLKAPYAHRGTFYAGMIVILTVAPLLLGQDYADPFIKSLLSLTLIGVFLLIMELVLAFNITRWNRFAKKYSNIEDVGVYYITRRRDNGNGLSDYLLLNLDTLEDSTVSLWGDPDVGTIVAVTAQGEVIAETTELVANAYFERLYTTGVLAGK